MCVPAEHSSLWPTSATSMCQFIWNGPLPTSSGQMLQSQDSPWPCPCPPLLLLQLQAPIVPLKQLLLLLMLQLQQQLLFCLMWKTQRAVPSMSRIWHLPQVPLLFFCLVSVFFESCMIVSFDRFGIHCLALAWSVSFLLHSLFCLEHLLLVCHCLISCHPVYTCGKAVPSSYV